MRILYLIIKQFNTLYEIRDLAVQGYPASAIAEKTAVRDFIVKRNISWEDILNCRHSDRRWKMVRNWKKQ